MTSKGLMRKVAFGAISLVLIPLAHSACAAIAGFEDSPNPTNDPNITNGDGGGPNDGDGGGVLVTADGLEVNPGHLELTANCGAAGAPHYFSIRNTSDKPVDYAITVPEGSILMLRDNDASVSERKGTLAPGQLEVIYLNVVASQPGNFAGDVFITTNGRTQPLPTQVSVKGGALAFLPSTFDFGESRAGVPNQQGVEIENTGTDAVNVLSFEQVSPVVDGGAPEFSVGAGGSLKVEPGTKVPVPITFLAGPASASVVKADFSPVTQQGTCGARAKLSLQGTRTDQNVTVSPATHGFGDVDCSGAPPGPKTITVSNYAPTPVDVTVSGSNAWLTVAPSGGVTVPAKTTGPGSIALTVTLNNPTPAQLQDWVAQISVAIPAPEASTKIVTVTAKTVGAILDISPTVLNGYVSGQEKSFNVLNVGNKFIYLKFTSSSSAFTLSQGNSAALNPSTFFGVSVPVKMVAAAGPVSADITTTRIDTPPWSFLPTSSNLCVPAAIVKASSP